MTALEVITRRATRRERLTGALAGLGFHLTHRVLGRTA